MQHGSTWLELVSSEQDRYLGYVEALDWDVTSARAGMSVRASIFDGML
jgi:hypothetical protein